MRPWVALSAVVLTACSPAPQPGNTQLYNGSTAGWQQAGPGGFTNEGGILGSYDGMGLFWYQAEEFGSYELTLDWRLKGDGNSGIFLGFPASDDPISAVSNGYEVQIDASDAPEKTTGAIYGFQSADIPARDRALKPAGEWNTFQIRVNDEHLEVLLNGTKVNDFTNTDPARSLAGHIGIQNHSAEDHAEFRDIRIKPQPR
jgi:hypothetical protein